MARPFFPALALMTALYACAPVSGNVAAPDAVAHAVRSPHPSSAKIFALGSAAVFEFAGGDVHARPKVAITDGVYRPYGLTIDGLGTLYVLNQGTANASAFDANASSITEYPAGASKPALTITFPKMNGGYPYPCALAADNVGTLYVVDCNNGSNIDVFPRGATQPAFIINNPWAPSTGFGPLVADSKGKLYITAGSGANGSNGVMTYDVPSQTWGWLWVSDPNYPSGVALDGTGGEFVSVSDGTHWWIRHLGIGNPRGYYSPKSGFMAFDTVDDLLYAISYSGTVTVQNPTTHKLLGTIQGLYGVAAVVVSPAAF